MERRGRDIPRCLVSSRDRLAGKVGSRGRPNLLGIGIIRLGGCRLPVQPPGCRKRAGFPSAAWPAAPRPTDGIRFAADGRSHPWRQATRAGARVGAPGETGGDRLGSWHAGASKQAILKFVQRVTSEGSPDFVPPAERVAVFDNDGTLWCEKPMPIQLDFILRRLVAMADQDPTLRTRQPWQAAYDKDYQWFGQVLARHYHGDDRDLPALAAGVLQAFGGITVEEFEAQADGFLRSAQHPTLGRGYLACAYVPMVELLGYLEANGFANYIASGGGRDFMRPISQEVYGVPRERVIGSSTSLAWQPDGAGGRIVRKPELDVVDDGPEKPLRIWSRVG